MGLVGGICRPQPVSSASGRLFQLERQKNENTNFDLFNLKSRVNGEFTCKPRRYNDVVRTSSVVLLSFV